MILNGFKIQSQFNKDFTEDYIEDSDEGYFQLMFNILKSYMTFKMIYNCYLKE